MSWAAVAVAGITAAGGYLSSRNANKGGAGTSALSRYGREDHERGTRLTNEGLAGLDDLDRTFTDRLKSPLGETGRGIFTRARGNLSDGFVRSIASGGARRRQLALQTGGSLSPEQIAALDAENGRSAAEGLFRGENELAIREGEMTLSETNKLFDRIEGIRRMRVSVGQDEKTRGLQAMLQVLAGKNAASQAIINSTLAAYNSTSNRVASGTPPRQPGPLD